MRLHVKYLLFSSIISVLTFSHGCTTTEVKKQSPTLGDVVAEWPKMEVGDTWHTTDWSQKHRSNNFYYRVSRVEEDGSFEVETIAEKGPKVWHTYYDSAFPMMKGVTCSDGDPNKVSFPLFVGKEWDAEGTFKSMRGKFDKFKTKYKCLKFENIKTRAGEFKAFKITRHSHNVSTGWKGQSYFWYSPKIKAIIKSKYEYRKGTNLIWYSLSSNVK